jgi:uncharacterized protein YukE
MTVSVSLVETTRPEALTTAATQIGGKVAQLNSTIDAQRNALRGLQGSWQGTAADAALARGQRDLAKQTGLRDRLTQAQQVLQAGGTHLAQARAAILGIVNSLRGQGWQVSDSGVATPPSNLPPVFKSTAAAWTAVVQKLLTTFGQIDAQTASNLPKFSPLSIDEPPMAGEGDKKDEMKPEEVGADDSRALQNGELTQEQRDRLVNNTTLAPDQQAALDSGTLTLPPEQMSYLQGFSRAFGDKTPAEIKAIMDKAGPDGGRVADVFQIASNPNIATGGKHALPEGIRRVLDGPALTQPYTEGVFQDGRWVVPPEPTGPLQPTSGLSDLADIIQRGNRDLQVGTTLDSGLMTKSQEMLAQSNASPIPQATGPGSDPMQDGPRWYHENVDPTLQNMFNALNKDDMVVHDAVAGHGAEPFLDDLTRHQWQDDGLAAGGLFDWVGETAANDSTGRAADTAHALAEYTSSHSNQLLNLPGTDSQSLGQVNPELTRDWARAFSPYMDDMVGMNTGDSSGLFAPLDPDSSAEPANTRRLMSVLYSDHAPLGAEVDPNAPLTASQILSDSSEAHINNYLDAGAKSAADAIPGEENFAMNAAGKLQAALDLGAYDERFDATHDRFAAQTQSYEMRSNALDLVKDVVGEVPGGSTVGGVGGLMKDFLLGPEPVMPGVQSVSGRDMFPVQLHMAQTLAAEGAGDPHFLEIVRSHLDSTGNFIIPPEDGRRDYGNFKDDINDYLGSVGRPGVINDMTQNYWNTYMQAIINATPPEHA